MEFRRGKLTVGQRRCLLGCDGEEIRVIAALLQIHHDIQKRHLNTATTRIQRFEITRQNILVIFLLHWRQFDSHNKFLRK